MSGIKLNYRAAKKRNEELLGEILLGEYTVWRGTATGPGCE
jgi:hypothetical protein